MGARSVAYETAAVEFDCQGDFAGFQVFGD
jgi:hypothetical protein